MTPPAKVPSNLEAQTANVTEQMPTTRHIQEQTVRFVGLFQTRSGSEPLALPREFSQPLAIRIGVVFQEASARHQAAGFGERHARLDALPE